MKKLLVMVLLLLSCAIAWGHNVPKFQATFWDFQRPDGPTITVAIDPNGTMTVLEDNQFIGQRYEGCKLLQP